MASPRLRIVASLLIGVLALGSHARAQDDDLDEFLGMGLEDLLNVEVVTASRKPQTLAEAPANIAVITRDMIRRRGYRTLEETLSDLPGFDFTTSQPSGEYPTHFIFRGITDVGQTKTLMMVDGIIQNDVSNGWFRNVGYAFTLNDVERIEVISGPGSALYGANAGAGLVHVITRPLDATAPGTEVVGKATFGRHGTVVPEALLRYIGPNGFRVQLAGRWYRTDGDGGVDRPDPGNYFHNNREPSTVLTTEHGEIPNETGADGLPKPLPDGFRTDLDDVCVRGKMEKGDFTLGLAYWDRKEGLGSEVVGYEYFANTPGIDYRARHAGYTVSGSHTFAMSESADLRSKLYLRNTRILPQTGFVYTYKYQSVSNGVDPPVADKIKGYHSEGYVAGLEQQIDLALSPKTSLIAGYQLEQEIKQHFGISLGAAQDASSTVVGSTYPTEIPSTQPMYFSTNAAGFVQVDHRPKEDLVLVGGLRFDADDEYGHVFNPRISLVRTPSQGIGLKLLYGQAFKSPTVFEQFDEFRGNRDLKPEKIKTAELELNYRFTGAAQVTAGYFHTRLTDLIVVAPNPDPARIPIGPNSEHLDYYQNIGSLSISGLTVKADTRFANGLSGYWNYALTFGESGKSIDNVARHKVNLGINCLLANKVNVNLRANWRGRTKAPESNRYFHPKDAASIAALGYDYVTEDNPDGYMDGHLILNLTLTGHHILDNRLKLAPQITVRNLLGTDHLGVGRQSGSGTRPVDSLQPDVPNPSGFIPAYHPQPGREVFVGLQLGFSQ
jgi:outer membrane receptor for ferrienterochelin and colicins